MTHPYRRVAKTAAVLLLPMVFCVCCAPTSNHYFPVTDLKERNNSHGFSITPPSGNGWYEKLNDATLYYLKKVPSSDYAIYTSATEISLADKSLKAEELLKMVERSKQLTPSSTTLKNVTLRVVLEPQKSPLCVRYTQEYEDHGANMDTNGQHVKIYKNGLVCLHPDTPNVGIDLCYVESSRSSLPLATLSYKEEGEYFLSSLRFFGTNG
jgi:hypothetical protein